MKDIIIEARKFIKTIDNDYDIVSYFDNGNKYYFNYMIELKPEEKKEYPFVKTYNGKKYAIVYDNGIVAYDKNKKVFSIENAFDNLPNDKTKIIEI